MAGNNDTIAAAFLRRTANQGQWQPEVASCSLRAIFILSVRGSLESEELEESGVIQGQGENVQEKSSKEEAGHRVNCPVNYPASQLGTS